MEDYSPAVTDHVIRFLTQPKVHRIPFARDITQIFLVLHLAAFAVLKRRRRSELPVGNKIAMVKVIMKVYHDFRETMVHPSVRGNFHARALALHFDTQNEPDRLLFNEKTLRDGLWFREPWPIHFPLDRLLSRGWTVKYCVFKGSDIPFWHDR
jgi:hypothetical protein